MAIKQDEILLIKTIIKNTKKPYDMIPMDKIYALKINHKRLYYLLNKMTHFLEYGTSLNFPWLDKDIQHIKDYYKNTHGVDLNDS